MSTKKSAKPKSKKTAAKKGRGAPTKYQPDHHPSLAFDLCAEFGAIDRQLAKLMGIAESTLNKWKIDHPEFMESIKKGKDLFDAKTVEQCLLKRAKGFRYTETTREPSAVADPETGAGRLVVTKKVSKMIIPDTTAIIFWLKNRNPRRWKDIKRTELTGAEDGEPLRVNIIDKYGD